MLYVSLQLTARSLHRPYDANPPGLAALTAADSVPRTVSRLARVRQTRGLPQTV